MTRYSSADNNTGVVAYEIIPDGISIKFRDGAVYLYNNQSAGKTQINKMRALANKGKGLTTYINRHVRENYYKKLK